MNLHQHDQCHGNDEFVGNRIQKGTERTGLIQFAGKIAIQPVGNAGGQKQQCRAKVTPLERQVEHQHQDGNCHHTYQGKDIGQIQDRVVLLHVTYRSLIKRPV